MIKEFKIRICDGKTDIETLNIIEGLFNTSFNNFWTGKYDYFQWYTNNVFY